MLVCDASYFGSTRSEFQLPLEMGQLGHSAMYTHPQLVLQIGCLFSGHFHILITLTMRDLYLSLLLPCSRYYIPRYYKISFDTLAGKTMGQ
jgi:hypothetical protein